MVIWGLWGLSFLRYLQRQAYNFEEFGNSLILDSATVKDGKYSFHLFQEEPTWSMLQVRYDAKALKAKNLKKPSLENNIIELVSDNGAVEILTMDTIFRNSVIKGSKATDDFVKFDRSYQKLYNP